MVKQTATVDTKPDVESELRAIQAANDGLLRPVDVVEFAADENTALHSRFTWDDSVAAHEYRLRQARDVIRIVIYLPSNEKPTRVFVSLEDDRKVPGGGYRDVVHVFNDPDMRKSFLQQALAEMQRFIAKYNSLKELESILTKAATQVRRKSKGAKSK